MPAKRKPKRKKYSDAPAAASIARIARGKRPQYFGDPAIDKLLWITLTLMEELSVTRDRLDTVERLLESRRVLRRADVERYRPSPPVEVERERRRAAFIARALRAVEAELDEATGRRGERSEAMQAVEA
jgi:hypothetical protein